MAGRILVLMGAILIGAWAQGQEKREHEFRVRSSELPQTILPQIEEFLVGVQRLRYYKEVDGKKSSYEVKFKKDKLHYSVEFDEAGTLEDVEILIRSKALPPGAIDKMTEHLKAGYGKYQIRKVQEQYRNEGNAQKTLKDAFGNAAGDVRYETIVATKHKKGFQEYEITFDSDGNHLFTRRSLPVDYDHVLFQ